MQTSSAILIGAYHCLKLMSLDTLMIGKQKFHCVWCVPLEGGQLSCEAKLKLFLQESMDSNAHPFQVCLYPLFPANLQPVESI